MLVVSFFPSFSELVAKTSFEHHLNMHNVIIIADHRNVSLHPWAVDQRPGNERTSKVLIFIP